MADAVQETLIRAWEHRHAFRGRSGVRAWLVAIMLNVCRSRRRGFWRWRLFLTRDAPGMQLPPRDPRTMAEERITRGALDRAVAELPPALQAPFVLRFFEEFTGAEIAEILGRRESSVWTRIYKARKQLARQLGETDEVFRRGRLSERLIDRKTIHRRDAENAERSNPER